MAFKTILKVDGVPEKKVLSCSYSLHQHIDQTGKPTSEVYGGRISISVASSSDSTLFAWALDSFGRKSGTITFYKANQDATLKELKFTDAYVVEFSESMDADSTTPMVEHLVISAKEIDLGGNSLKNHWAYDE